MGMKTSQLLTAAWRQAALVKKDRVRTDFFEIGT
jgi:hypothetical protein